MSQFPAAASSVESRPTANGPGFFGFLCSVFGLVCTAGALCPIGFIVSLLALRKQPRGFAIAGSIIGGLGTLLCILLIVLSLLTIAIAKGVAGAIHKGAPYIKSVADGASLYHQVNLYKEAHGAAPKSLDDLHVDASAMFDGWGHKFRYQLNDDGSFIIVSDGPDGKQGTLDDIRSASDQILHRKARSRRQRDPV